MLFILDKDMNAVGLCMNTGIDTCPYFNDEMIESIEDGAQSYEFDVPADHPTAGNITSESYILRTNRRNELVLFKVRSITETKDSSGQVLKRVFCESAALELIHDIVRPVTLESSSAINAVRHVLQGTTWNVGTVEWLGINNFEFLDYPTVLNAIQSINELYGGEIVFRVEFKNGRVIGKYVDLLRERGTNEAFRFDYTTDITDITRTEDSSKLVTALIGVGSNDENGNPRTFSNIEVTRYLDDGTPVIKPLGLDYVENPQALQRHGINGKHRFGVYKVEETDPYVILNRTWDELLRSSDPLVSYAIKVLDLERIQNNLNFSHKTPELGDRGQVVDYSFEPPIIINSRIIERRTSFTDPSRDEVIIGNFIPYETTEIEMIQDLQELIRQRAGTWETGASGEMIYKAPSPPENPEKDMLWIDTSRIPEVLSRYDGTRWIKVTPTQADDVGAITEGQAQDISDISRQIAEENAAADAARKAEAARQAAEAAAATDATNKAETARQQAIEAANNYTDGAVTNIDNSLRDFVQSYGQKIISQGTTAPGNAAIGDLWIDTSTTPYIWRRYNGNQWIAATPTNLSQLDGAITSTQIAENAITAAHIAANTITSDLISTTGLDAGVIKFGTMSGDRIRANSLDASALQAGSVIADDIIFTGTLQGVDGTFSGTLDSVDGAFSGRLNADYMELGPDEIFGAWQMEHTSTLGFKRAERISDNPLTYVWMDPINITAGNTGMTFGPELGEASFYFKGPIDIRDNLYIRSRTTGTTGKGKIEFDPSLDSSIENVDIITHFDSRTGRLYEALKMDDYYKLKINANNAYGATYVIGELEVDDIEIPRGSITGINGKQAVRFNDRDWLRINNDYDYSGVYIGGDTTRVAGAFEIGTFESGVQGYRFSPGTEPLTNNRERGFCGYGTRHGGVSTGTQAGGVGVNFRTKKTYVPSSIDFTQLAAYGLTPNATQITADGFWLYMTASIGGYTGHAYWRGYYEA